MVACAAGFSAAGASRAALLFGNILFAFVSPVSAGAFLGKGQDLDLPDGGEVGRDLLADLERVAGQDHRTAVEARVALLADVLRPTFNALPRTGEDKIDAASVRYLLHRVFVDRHGWHVRGLHAEGAAWDSASPADMFQDHRAVHGLFSDRLAHGFSLRDVAVFAATLEKFVHMETVARLETAYNVLDLPTDQDVEGVAKAEEVLDTFMAMFVFGIDHTTASKAEVRRTVRAASDTHKGWNETQEWIRGVRREVLSAAGAGPQGAAASSPLSFNASTRVVEEAAERYGRWQNQDCDGVKASLVELEGVAGTGRVWLDTFYESALNGSWMFTETEGYLRALGALDETDPRRPSVIIPNYVNSPSNCLASSKYYSVCCIDECEVILASLERDVAAPLASPARVAELVARLPSATVPAPREVPAALLRRLEEIAAANAGQVPLHGRLFAQWLHHVYPRECPFPPLFGTTQPTTPKEFKKQTGKAALAEEQEMREHIKKARSSSAFADHPGPSAPIVVDGMRDMANDTCTAMPWSAQEELFVGGKALEPAVALRSGWWGGRIAFAALAVSIGLSLARVVAAASASTKASTFASDGKCCV
uniref:Phospholipase B-like n=1 Tax=Zooxanthella nutricula TaxID=1333877 RepID=A0A6U6TAN5_9DINO|mmetsp:Transcript_78503/g.240199  ORF Transcript_78503/g.240199 Transcript_78503/m.240199 type:complete len:595 (+) Transcript_78503:82-1866(+)